MKTLRAALAQINPTVGDLAGNTEKIIHYINEARKEEAAIVAFPELAITGYPPEDLLLKPQFIEDNLEALRTVSRETEGIIVVIGFVDRKKDIFNAAAVMSGGRIEDVYHKAFLPNYGVFDELRYFKAGSRCSVYEMGEISFGVTICEDIWYPGGPIRLQAISGADFIININASPYTMGKAGFRERMLSTRATDHGVIIAYVNAVGGQDELVFDGGSFVVDEHGNLVARATLFKEELLLVDLDLEAVFMRRLHDPRERQEALLPGEKVDKISIPVPDSAKKTRHIEAGHIEQGKLPEALPIEEEVYNALVLGVKDYVRKNGFREVVIGLSGGVDSSLVASLAVDALDKENVHGLFMPSRFTSGESREDAYALAENLGMEIREVPIDNVFEKYLEELGAHFKGLPPDTTEENLQARIRGNILMAFSNKFGRLVLTTGNKSEMSVGYATLYGDMAGGFAVIKDVPKTLVYRLARWRNSHAGRDLIPKRVMTKEPTAELRPDQKDTDSLPPYAHLDPVLKAYVEEDRSFEEILSLGGDPGEIKRVIRMVDLSEYKRRQAPPGIKITARAFGRDRRFPITNRYRSF